MNLFEQEAPHVSAMAPIDIAVTDGSPGCFNSLAVTNVNCAVLGLRIDEDVPEMKLVEYDLAEWRPGDVLGVAGKPDPEFFINRSDEP